MIDAASISTIANPFDVVPTSYFSLEGGRLLFTNNQDSSSQQIGPANGLLFLDAIGNPVASHHGRW